jgi:hypothetical protein
MDVGTQAQSKQQTCHIWAQQRSGTKFVGLELPTEWGCQKCSKEQAEETWNIERRKLDRDMQNSLLPRPSLEKIKQFIVNE